MALLTEIPKELLDMIVSYIEDDRRALLGLARTCRALQPTAQLPLFRNAVSLDSKQLELFGRSIHYNNNLGALVRRFGPVDIDGIGQITKQLYFLMKHFVNLEELQVNLRHYVYKVGSLTGEFFTLDVLATLKTIIFLVADTTIYKRGDFDGARGFDFFHAFMRLPMVRTITLASASRCPTSSERWWDIEGERSIPDSTSYVLAQLCIDDMLCFGPYWFCADSLSYHGCLRVIYATIRSPNAPSQMKGVNNGLLKLCDTLEELVLLVLGDLRLASMHTHRWPELDLSNHKALKKVHTNAVFFHDSRTDHNVPEPSHLYGRLPPGLETIWIELGTIPDIFPTTNDASRLPKRNEARQQRWLSLFDCPSTYGLHTLQEATLKDTVKIPGTLQFFERSVFTFRPPPGHDGALGMMQREDNSFKVSVFKYWDRPLGPWTDWSR